ncbi:TPA: hypothetical protein ACHOQR_003933 [Escherichia coli]|nr:hypothetical protein [Escherichia coli]
MAGGAAPYIAEIIKQTTPDGAGRVAAHAVVNAALAVAQGNNALAGAAGAATGEMVGMIATQMYGKPVRYDKSHPVGELTVDGQTIRQSSVNLVLFAKRVNCVSLYCSC